jgi:hypothetical protein
MEVKSNMSQGVILFSSIHFALQAEKMVKGQGFSIDLIPVPRQLSSDCGICMLIQWEEREKLYSLLEEGGVKIEGVHLLPSKEKLNERG